MEQFGGVDLEDIDEEEYERLQQALLESMNDAAANEIDMDQAEAAGLVQNVGQGGTGNQGMNNQEEEKKM